MCFTAITGEVSTLINLYFEACKKNPCYGVAGIFLWVRIDNIAKREDLTECTGKADGLEWRVLGY